MLVKAFFAFIISFLVTFYLIPICIVVANKLRFIDNPDGKTKQHLNPTPYMGGVAVYLGFLVALCLTFPFENDLLLFFFGSTLLLFVGVIDDLIVLTPAQKFLGQIIATLCFLKAGFFLKAHFFSNYWNVPISALWILIVVNSFNLVDVMDGLATLLAFSATCSFLVLAVFFKLHFLIILLSAFLGPLCAFFWYNKPTAKIYLGDAGALFIGGFLATIPFFYNWGVFTPLGYLTPLIIVAIPLLEFCMLIVIRTYKKIPFYRGSPDHFSIYLQRNGYSKTFILGYIFVLNTILGVISFLFLINAINLVGLSIAASVFLCIWLFMLNLKRT